MLGCGFTSSSGGAGLLVEGTLPGEPMLLKNESRRKSRLKLSELIPAGFRLSRTCRNQRQRGVMINQGGKTTALGPCQATSAGSTMVIIQGFLR